MIIALYESSYPIEKSGTPTWDELPVGYFTADKDGVRQSIEKDDPMPFSGVFSVCIGDKPRVGEHLLAVFALDNTRYICNSTISYRSEKDVVDSDEWEAQLRFSNIIRKW